ncbi:50S ribosomal protein L20 [bacterium]|jgi:large subunit ribosomal protein L20|nr:50S ribosomal protein L20 [bacterium]
MARVKRGNVSRKRHKKILKLAKGFRGSLSKLYRPAHQAVLHALSNSTRDRKRKKRDFRRLWIARINAALGPFSTSYSTFINLLKKKEIEINRKSLSEIAIRRPDVFSDVVQFTKS